MLPGALKTFCTSADLLCFLVYPNQSLFRLGSLCCVWLWPSLSIAWDPSSLTKTFRPDGFQSHNTYPSNSTVRCFVHSQNCVAVISWFQIISWFQNVPIILKRSPHTFTVAAADFFPRCWSPVVRVCVFTRSAETESSYVQPLISGFFHLA